MAIIQGVTDSYRAELLEGVHNFLTDTFKIALYYEVATISPLTTVYTTTGEVSWSGYTAGGQALTGVTVQGQPNLAYVTLGNQGSGGSAPSWSAPTGSGARGALIYNASKSNKSVCVLDFGTTQYGNGSTFTVTFPPSPSINGPLRMA